MTWRSRPAAALFAVGLLAAIGMYWATPFGPGVSPDSTDYFAVAGSLLSGHGFQSDGAPMTHYPPVYPILLAMCKASGLGSISRARAFHAVFYGVNLVLTGLAVALLTEWSMWAVAAAVVFFLSSSVFLFVYSMAWSEAPFLAFALGGYLLFCLYLAKNRRSLLIGSAVLIGLALATRYSGVPLLLPPLILLVRRPGPARRRFIDAVIMAGIGSAPLGAWLLRNMVTSRATTDRSLVFHPTSFFQVKQLLNALHYCWLPIDMFGGWRLVQTVIVLGLAAAAVRVIRKAGGNAISDELARSYDSLVYWFTGIYLAFILAMSSLVDAAIEFDVRIVAPVQVFLVVFAISLAWRASRVARDRTIWRAFLVAMFLLACVNADRSMTDLRRIHSDGAMYLTHTWRTSESLDAVRRLPPGVRVYSNGPDVITFRTGRRVLWIPEQRSEYTLRPNPNVAAESAAVAHEVAQGDAVLLFLRRITFRSYLEPESLLVKGLPADAVTRMADGVMYGKRK